MTPKHPPGPPMTLGNMREPGVQHLIAYCLNDMLRSEGSISSPTWDVCTARRLPRDSEAARARR